MEGKGGWWREGGGGGRQGGVAKGKGLVDANGNSEFVGFDY